MQIQLSLMLPCLLEQLSSKARRLSGVWGGAPRVGVAAAEMSNGAVGGNQVVNALKVKQVPNI